MWECGQNCCYQQDPCCHRTAEFSWTSQSTHQGREPLSGPHSKFKTRHWPQNQSLFGAWLSKSYWHYHRQLCLMTSLNIKRIFGYLNSSRSYKGKAASVAWPWGGVALISSEAEPALLQACVLGSWWWVTGVSQQVENCCLFAPSPWGLGPAKRMQKQCDVTRWPRELLKPGLLLTSWVTPSYRFTSICSEHPAVSGQLRLWVSKLTWNSHTEEPNTNGLLRALPPFDTYSTFGCTSATALIVVLLKSYLLHTY